MTSNADQIARKLEDIPIVQLLVGVFVSRQADGMVNVDFGDGAVTILSAGVTEPLPGDSVRVLRTTNASIMLGPSVQVSGIGQVTATGSPLLTVTTSLGSMSLPRISGYTAVIGDNVLIDWDAGGVVIGKVTAVPAGAYTPPPAPGPTAFSADFRAVDSGTYQGGWWTNDVWVSTNNFGCWFYGAIIADTIPDAATITRVQVYLPEFYNDFPAALTEIGVHSLPAKSGAPDLSNPSGQVPGGAGWRDLPTTIGDALKTGPKVGIGAHIDGFHKFTSRAADADSGLLRIDWTV